MRQRTFVFFTCLFSLLGASAALGDNDHYKQHQKGERFAFALVGDGPYAEDQEPKWDETIRQINRDRDVRFVIHAGDIKGGGEMCTDELLVRRFDQLQQLRRPLVYTPGDNEWTDCHRTSNGSYVPTERLDFIRNLFFPYPGYTTGGRYMRVQTQANAEGFERFVENTLFLKERIVFSQIHVVGSNNNLRPWDQLPGGDLPLEREAEFAERSAAGVEWLKHTFMVAKKLRAPGVFLTIHANPNFNEDRTNEGLRGGFNSFLDVLEEQVADYGKPVVIAHGDSHFFRMDTPYLLPWYYNDNAATSEENRKIGNLIRVETFGHFDNHWVKVEVDPNDDAVFRVVPRVVKANL